MSDRACNYCCFKSVKANAKRAGMKVATSPHTGVLGGVDVYRLPPSVRLTELGKQERAKYFVAWYMELTDHCCC
jgi:hypothetical protein